MRERRQPVWGWRGAAAGLCAAAGLVLAGIAGGAIAETPAEPPAAEPPAPAVDPETTAMVQNAERPYALLMVIDGVPLETFERLRAAGELPNLDAHLYRRGYHSLHHTATFPPITFSAMASLLTGDLPASHGIPNFQWVNRETGGYRNYIGLDLLSYQADLLQNTRSVFQYFPNERTLSFGLQVSAGANYQRGIISSFLDPLRQAKDTSYIEKSLNPDKPINPVEKAINLVNPAADGNVLTLANPVAPGGLLRGTLATLSPQQRAIRRQIPRLVAYYDWHTDKLGHAVGVDHPSVLQSLRDADATFGRLVAMYEDAGLYDQTYFVLGADHGQAPTSPRYVPLDAHFKELGLRVKYISHELGVKTPKLKRLDSYIGAHSSVYGANMVMGTTGAGAVHIDLVKHNGKGEDMHALWAEQLVYGDLTAYEIDGGTINLVDALNAIPEGDFAIVRDAPFVAGRPHRTRVFNAGGESLITSYPGDPVTYSYEVLTGDDPLGYATYPGTRPFVGAPPVDGRMWLAACAGAYYADAVVQLSQILELDNSGTVILVPKAGASFNAQAKSRHGGILRREMQTVFAISGPGLPAPPEGGTFPLSRTIDIVPTLLYALDQPGVDYAEFDGIVVPELRTLLDAQRAATVAASAPPPGE